MKRTFAALFIILFLSLPSYTGDFFLLLSKLSKKTHRTVTVILAIDDSPGPGTADPDFKAFKSAVLSVSRDLEKEFLIRLQVAGPPVRWTSSREFKTVDRMFPGFMASVSKKLDQPFRGENHADIVIGLTRRKGLKGKHGLSLYRAGYILVRHGGDKSFFKKIIKHEIFHLFGATHVDNNESVMDRYLRGGRLLSLNRRLIRLHRDRDFKGRRFPLALQKMPRAVAIYRDIARDNERLTGTPRTRVDRNLLRRWVRSGSPSIGPEALRFLRRDFNRLEDVYIRLAFLYVELKKYPEALEECRRVLRINPGSDEANNLAGIALRRSGNIDEAIIYYNRALEINPRYQRVYYNLGIAYMKKKDYPNAISAYRRAVAANPNFADAWNNLGFVYLERGSVDQAAGFFRKAIQKNPYYPLAHANLAEALLRKGEVDAAMTHARKAAQLNDKLPGVFNILGKILMEKNDPDGAEKAYLKAVELDKTYGPAFFNLGNLYLEQKQWARARDFFNKSLKITPGLAAAYSRVGDSFMMEGRYVEADAAFQRAMEHGYDTAGLFVNWSTVKIHRENYASAVTLARRAAGKNPKLAMARYNLGMGLMMTGRLNEAEKEFKTAVSLDPGLKNGWSGLGDLYLRVRKYESAAAAYQKSLEIDRADGGIHNNLAVVFYFLKKYPLALRHLKEAERFGFPVNPEFKKSVLDVNNSNR